MKITLIETGRKYTDVRMYVDILRVEVGRFNGALFSYEKSTVGTFWDAFYIVGIKALKAT